MTLGEFGKIMASAPRLLLPIEFEWWNRRWRPINRTWVEMPDGYYYAHIVQAKFHALPKYARQAVAFETPEALIFPWARGGLTLLRHTEPPQADSAHPKSPARCPCHGIVS